MAIIPQINLFSWEEIEDLGDLKRLKLVIEHLPDEPLMKLLEKKRKNGRNDYPIRAIWNTILAGIVFEHKSIESLRRELSRNAQLRFICGLELRGVPTSSAYSRFMKNLLKLEDEVNNMFYKAVNELKELLPTFGESLAIDSKAIQSFANHRNKNSTEDGRRDLDADYGIKSYKGHRDDGTLWEKTVRWFGYKLHLIVDSNYELPISYSITKASVSDVKEAHRLIDELESHPSELLENTKVLSGDKGYDDTKLMERLWDDHEIKTVIDIRNMWKEKNETRLIKDYSNVAHDYKGTFFCYCPVTGTERAMVNGGFEKDRNTLKKLCPANQYGITCKGAEKCPVKQGFRIPLHENRRVFTPIDRSSYKWEREYNKRTAVERVNSRLDISFGFENHTIRGLKKMKVKVGLSLVVMLTMAIGHIKENRLDKIRNFTS